MNKLNSKVTYFWHNDPLTNRHIKFAKIVILNEPMNIRGVKFKMDNVYNVPANEVHNKNLYTQPLENPRQNIDKAFSIYRKKMGLLKPQEIRQIRFKLHLSQPEVAAILGMGYATLSRIENNHIIQSISQDTELRNLFNGPALIHLIKDRLPSIKSKKPSHVKIKDLLNTVRLVRKANDNQESNDMKRLQIYYVMKKLPIKGMIEAYCSRHHFSKKQLRIDSHISKSELNRMLNIKA